MSKIELRNDWENFDNYADRTNAIENLWYLADSQVYCVLDERGWNVAEAKVRHLENDVFVYVDETDSWSLRPREDVDKMLLVPEEDYADPEPE